jgi:UDP-glucose 4-epimerase
MTHVSLSSSPQHKAVCVTGGAGFIGTWLVRGLLESGHRVVVLDDLSNATRAPEPTAGLRFVRGSVLDESAVDEATRGAGLLIHLAGVVGMRLATAERKRAYQVAVEGTEILLDRTPGIPALLMSSSAVYGITDDAAVDESMAGPLARTLAYDGGHYGYACGKWRMEEIGRAAVRPILSVRPFNVVGPGQMSTWGMVIPSFVKQAQSAQALTVYDDGLQSRSFACVTVFVDSLLRAIANPLAWRLPDRALNIGVSTPTTILDLAKLILQRSGSKSGISHVPYASVFENRTDLRGRVPDTSRLHSLIGPIGWPPISKIVDDVLAEAGR